MSYHKTLSEMIDRSGLTLKEIAAKCSDKGVRIDPSYISKLQSGNYSPASEEINKALAESCDRNPDELVYAAYIEKAPSLIKNFIQELLQFFRTTASSLAQYAPENTANIIQDEFINLSDQDLVQRILTEREILAFLSHLIENQNKSPREFKEPSLDALRKTLIGITMPDSSMEPLIPAGARIHLHRAPFISGRIYALTTSDDSYLIRRCVFQNSEILLISEHKDYPPVAVEREHVNIVGKVASITTNVD